MPLHSVNNLDWVLSGADKANKNNAVLSVSKHKIWAARVTKLSGLPGYQVLSLRVL